MRRTTFLLGLFILCFSLSAQQVRKVRGEYTYHAPENITLEEAKHTALERAKIQTIADEFGTVIAQMNTTFVQNDNGQSVIDFHSLGASEVKGEWIETIGEPIYTIRYERDMLVVKVCIDGYIRETSVAKIDFTAKLLCNGVEDKYESSDFKDGDDLYLSFSSPTDGYVAVYLIDANKGVYCLLPYQNDSDGKVFVEHGKHYVFFSPNNVPNEVGTIVDEYYLTCNNKEEVNYLYVIFSPNEFTKASDTDAGERLPRTLSFDYFQKWLSRCRKQDIDMTVETKQITIHKN